MIVKHSRIEQFMKYILKTMAADGMHRRGMQVDQLPIDLFTEDKEELKNVVTDLTSWRCCTRCILRFLGESQPCVFQQPIEVLNAWVLSHLRSDVLETGNATARPLQCDNEVCVACLGLLQETFNSTEFLDKIERAVKDEDHEFSSFSIAISSPVTIILREHSLLITLREKYKSVFYGRGKESVCPINVVWKYTHSEELSNKFKATAAHAKADSPFEISMTFTHPYVEKECNFLFELFPGTFVRRKHNKYGWELFPRMTVLKVLNDVSDARFQKYYQSPPRQLEDKSTLQSIVCTHDAIYIAGRYNKYSRMLPQSPWIINGERKAESSIEELICDKLCNFIKTKDYKLSAAGREDVDVKMLGNGRPFCVEFVNPHRVNLTKQILKQLQRDINTGTEDIQVSHLQVVDKEATNVMKEGETEKTKKYSALCWTEDVITQDVLDSKLLPKKDLVLDQKTPIRVLHRRPLATRQRTVYSMTGEMVDDHHLKLHLSTQAGTYIKEFVHGDFGRTKPSLGNLLNTTCDILELDVEAVELEWPPPVEAEQVT